VKKLIKLSISYLIIMITMLLSLETDLLYAATMPDPKERIDFWRNNYTELLEDKDPHVIKARQIFNRVLKAAGNRYGVIPRLHVIEENPLNVVLPVSIPDGWIIISKKVLEMSYREPEQGDDRLAFVLAHEIAHLLDDDFWHINFFSALALLKTQDTVKPKVLNELKGIFDQTAKIQAKELRADERGILYAAMAGFNPNAIVKNGEVDSFFHQWQKMLNLSQLTRHDGNETHPSSLQRSAAVLARLQKVADEAGLFKLGLIFYQSGNFELASRAFGEFLRYFPSREVYHNLAASHHQLALLHYAEHNDDKHLLPFRLPITADPYSRAAYGVSRAAINDQQLLFKQHISKAIIHYEASIQQDAHYTIAYLNLAGAYIVNNEPYKAIATLQDVHKKQTNNAMLMNVLGVGFYQAGNVKKAIQLLRLATAADPNYDAPYYNLGKIAYLDSRKHEAIEYWSKFVKLNVSNRWARFLVSNYNIPAKKAPEKSFPAHAEEKMKGIQIGHYADEIPPEWGKAKEKKYHFDQSVHTLLEYKNGITVVLDGNEIRIVVATPNYKGKSNQGVKVGSSTEVIVAGYGNPGIKLQSTQGDSLLYPRDGITFQMQKNKVVSWMIY